MEKDWGFSHLDFHVKDMQECVDYYQSIGVGVHVTRLQWRTPTPRPPEALEAKSLTLRNREPVDTPALTTPEQWAQRMTSLLIGSAHVEIMHNPGIEVGYIGHIAFNAADLRGETQRLIQKGCEIVYAHLTDTFVGENIIDTRKFGNIMTQFRPDPQRMSNEREREWMAGFGVSDWKFRGVGIAVNDLDKTVEYYQLLDIAAFHPEFVLDSGSVSDFKVNGKTPDSTVKARTRIAQVGSMVYEFTQPLEGETIYKESLDKRSEGVNDFVFTVDDLDKETAKLAEKGVQVILSGNPKNGGAFAYFDTRKVGDMMIKLIQAE